MTRTAHKVIALVGKPNTGKSTLFNKLIGKRQAIVHDRPGITRDRLYETAQWGSHYFTVVDTGGITLDKADFQTEIRVQTAIAIEEADLIVFVVDARHELDRDDEKVLSMLRKCHQPVLIALNKLEGRANAQLTLWKLNPYETFPISAMHGEGIGDLLDRASALLRDETVAEVNDLFKIAILGRPNVGKSSLLNVLVGADRAIVSPIAGTTRDAVYDQFTIDNETFQIIDTAGIQRKSKLIESVEHYALGRALHVVENADLVLLVLDPMSEPSHFDAVVGGEIDRNFKPAIIVVNKSDLIAKGEALNRNELVTKIRSNFKFLVWAPVVFVSALNHKNISELKQTMLDVRIKMRKRIKTNTLNQFISELQLIQPPKPFGGNRLQIYFVRQDNDVIPTFIFFVNRTAHLHFSYQRFLENKIRETFGYDGTPIKLIFRNKNDQNK